MMKKLLFCLLVLTGTGVLSSCQQDEIVKETPAEKGATIRASLPVDAQSRVTLGATDGTTTDIYWEEDDELTVNIDGTDYTFTISNFEANAKSTTATFTCANAPALTAGTYTFNYGDAPAKQQSGTLEGLNKFHQMQATYTAEDGDTWNDVSLTFDTQVAIVEIEIALPDGVSATKVSLYDATNGALIAFAKGSTFTRNAYFALAPTTIRGGLVLAETASNDVYMAEATTSKTLEAGKLYSIKKTMVSAVANDISASGSNVKYALFGATDPVVVFYGEGKMEFSSRNWSSATRAIVVEGITNIANETFSYCSDITSITIPESVTSIGNFAFRSCSNITSITIPESVTSIGSHAFLSCQDLTRITIPNSVTSIGIYAFQYCYNLTSITIPNSVTSIEEGTFSDCTGLNSITIPNGVTSIGSYAFSGCNNLPSITIPDGVISIGSYAFSGCNNLPSITIPDGVTSIGSYAFWYCEGLTSITIPDGVTSIGRYAFQNCKNLTSITIPNGVTSIEDGTFSNCKGLTSITIPNGVTSFGSYAFSGCNNLIKLTCNATTPPTLAGTNPFVDSSSIKIYVPAGLVSNYKSTWSSLANKIEAIIP